MQDAAVIDTTFDSDVTLLDFDLVVIDVCALSRFFAPAERQRDASRLLALHLANEIRDVFSERKRELATLFARGKMIIAFMAPLEHAFSLRDSNRNFIDNYDWLPQPIDRLSCHIKAGTGSTVTLTDPNSPIAPYHGAFKGRLRYCAYLDSAKLFDHPAW